ncbi:MAG: DDE-type integrase/transposase/recombinase [Vulcanisaeta sp.]
MSLRRASHVLEPIIKSSHVAIWKWIQKYSFVFDFDVDKHDVNSIFVDETEINVGGKKAWLWVAYEPQLKAFLSFYISWLQNSLDAYYFIRRLVKKYGGKTIYTELFGTLMHAGVDHVVYEQSLKNLMERMNEHIKDRTEAFDDLFPCRKPKFEHVKNWFKAFRFFYVFTNEDIDIAPLSNEQLSEWVKPIC